MPGPIIFSGLAGLPIRGLTDCRPLIFQQHQLAPSVGSEHLCLSRHRYKRTVWSGRNRWKSTLKRSPPIASLQRWLRWRSKCEISLPTFRNLPGKTKSLTRSSYSTRLRRGKERTREKVRKEAMLSLDKSVSKNNSKNNSRSNNKSSAKSKKVK